MPELTDLEREHIANAYLILEAAGVSCEQVKARSPEALTTLAVLGTSGDEVLKGAVDLMALVRDAEVVRNMGLGAVI